LINTPANSACPDNNRAAAGNPFGLPVPPLALGLKPQYAGQGRADGRYQRQRVFGHRLAKHARRISNDHITAGAPRANSAPDETSRISHPGTSAGRPGGHPPAAAPTATTNGVSGIHWVISPFLPH
jgi:hypothetical protein